MKPLTHKLGLTHTISFRKHKGKTIEQVISQNPNYTSFKLTNKARELLDNTQENTADLELEEIYKDFQYGRNND